MGQQKYITAMNFKEVMLSDRGAFVAPKSILVASDQPIFTLQCQLLELVFSKVCLQHNSLCIKTYKTAHADMDENEWMEGFGLEYE